MELELSAYSLATLKANEKFLLGNPIDFYDKDTKRTEIEKDIYNLHDKFEDLRVKKINQLNKEINKVFRKITNLDLQSSKYQIFRF